MSKSYKQIVYVAYMTLCVLQFVQLASTANCVLKCALTVPTTPHVTTGTVTVSVCLAGLLLTVLYVSATEMFQLT